VYRWRTGILLAATLTAVSALGTVSPAGATPAGPGTPTGAAASGNVGSVPTVSAEAWAAGRASYGADTTATQAIQAYWTPQRMRAAKPVEDSAAYLDAVRVYDQNAQAAKDQARAGTGRAQPDSTPHSVGPKDGAIGKLAAPAAYNPGFAYWQPTARTSGKVFFDMAGGSWVCSATIVNSEGQNTVWTAGHCVNQGGGSGVWASNWVFVPAYDDDLWNSAPYGYWTAVQLWSRTAWINSSDFAEDMGVAIMGQNFGYHIVGYLGGQGLTTGAGRRVWENTFGYPAESPFDGGNLYECWGTTWPEWEFLAWWSETLVIPCDMTRGESGGGWLYGWDGNWGWLDGINSRIDRIVNPTVTMSPYFDDTAWSLYNATRYL
jgi:hypothetical protein